MHALAALALLILPQQANLEELYDKHQYFDLRDAVRRSSPDAETSFYRGIVANKFNRLSEASDQLRRYAETGGKHHQDALETLADTYSKQGKYGLASDTYRRIIATHGSTLTKAQVAGLENVAQLWGSFKDVPPQRISLTEDVVIKRSSGTADGLRFPVEANGKSYEFLVDTGANISTVTLSSAIELKMKLIPAKIEIGSITGKKVEAQLGFMPKMTIGHATVENAIFLVMQDKDLTFGTFVVPPIIGFPIIEALGELTFYRDGSVTIHAKPSSKGEQNLLLDELTPHVYAHYKGQRLIFAFDTGASHTDIYYPFLKRFSADVASQSKVGRTSFGGAGGTKSPLVYQMKNLALSIGGQEVTVPSVRVHPAINREEERYINGNLGQDLIRQFGSMTINWRTMTLRFGQEQGRSKEGIARLLDCLIA